VYRNDTGDVGVRRHDRLIGPQPVTSERGTHADRARHLVPCPWWAVPSGSVGVGAPSGCPDDLEPWGQFVQPLPVQVAQQYRVLVGKEVVFAVAGWACGSRERVQDSRPQGDLGACRPAAQSWWVPRGCRVPGRIQRPRGRDTSVTKRRFSNGARVPGGQSVEDLPDAGSARWRGIRRYRRQVPRLSIPQLTNSVPALDPSGRSLVTVRGSGEVEHEAGGGDVDLAVV
jgi:hypothetical protein